jgi:hypothetical protein
MIFTHRCIECTVMNQTREGQTCDGCLRHIAEASGNPYAGEAVTLSVNIAIFAPCRVCRRQRELSQVGIPWLCACGVLN